ncbi:MAG: glycosyltransferase family 4 protein [Acidimicrobiales bacterium]
MRIAHVMNRFPSVGGASRAVEGAIVGARQLGHEAMVLTYRADRAEVGRPSAEVRVEAAGGFAFELLPWGPPGLQEPLVRRMVERVGELDVIVLHGAFVPNNARLVPELRRVTDATLVACPHDAYTADLFATRTARKRAYFRAVERRYLRSVDAIEVRAPSHCRVLAAYGVHTPCVVTPGAVGEEELVRAAALRERRVANRRRPGCRPTLLMLGRWRVFEKGLDLLLEAVSERSLAERVRVVLVGPEQGGRGEVEALIRRYGLEDTVEAAGFSDDAWRHLERADLLVLPSRKEGFGLVGLEALAAGVPVVVSDRAGLAEYVGREQGVVVSPADPLSLRRALLDALAHLEELSAAAHAAAPRLAATLNWRVVVERWLADLGHITPLPAELGVAG